MTDKQVDDLYLPLLNHLWRGLKPGARRLLLHVMQRLSSDYTGTAELVCNKGGVRVVRYGQEFRDNDVEVRGMEDGELQQKEDVPWKE